MADKEWLEVAVQRMLDIWLSDVPGWLRLLEIYFLYCTEIFSSCIPHGLPLCSFLKRCQLGLSFFFFFSYRKFLLYVKTAGPQSSLSSTTLVSAVSSDSGGHSL